VVTIRHRDTMVQEKLKVAEIEAWLRGAIRGWKRPEREG
jgi:glycyl-tRNA synthetase (class II)